MMDQASEQDYQSLLVNPDPEFVQARVFDTPKNVRYPATRQTIEPSEKFLPGTGERKDEFCGRVRYMAVCIENPDHIKIPVGHSCNRPVCPICWSRWCHRGADAIGSKISGWRKLAGSPAPCHVVVSPPPGTFPEDTLTRVMLKDFYRLAAYAGLVAGSVIVHHWRIKAGTVIDPDSKTAWEWVRKRADWRDLVVWSPHFHVIGFGHLMKSRDFEKETGWIYKNKGALWSRDDVEAVAYYALSHAAIEERRKASTDFGFMHSKHVKVKFRWAESSLMRCPVCGGELHYMHPNSDKPDKYTAVFSQQSKIEYVWRKGPPLGPGPNVPVPGS